MFEFYHDYAPSWGSLRSALEEDDLSRDGLRGCLAKAVADKDYLGAFLLEVLLEFSDDDLAKLGGAWRDYSPSEFMFAISEKWQIR